MYIFKSVNAIEDNEREIEEAISRLKQEGLVNDKLFAEWYCTQRQEFNQRSQKLLTLELQMKGVDRSIMMEREKLISYLLRKAWYLVIVIMDRALK